MSYFSGTVLNDYSGQMLEKNNIEVLNLNNSSRRHEQIFLRSLSSEVHVILMNSTMYYFKVKTGDIWLIINAAEISKLIFKILSKNMQRNCMTLTKSFYVMPC